MNKLILTWDSVSKYCDTISNYYKDAKITAIVGIGKGGLIPAVMIANRLKVQKLFNVGVASYDENNKQGYLEFYQFPKKLSKETILIVDDLIDSGKTMKEVKATIGSSSKVYSTTLFRKVSTTVENEHFYVREYADDTWIVFPWET